MDTILIANESLKHLSDSVHVLMPTVKVALNDSLKINFPDSIKTFKAPEEIVFLHLTKTQLISVSGAAIGLCSLLYSYINFRLLGKREIKKEEIRLKEVKEHVLTWLNINKFQCIKAALECENGLQKLKEFNPLFQTNKLSSIKFYFEKITEINAVDLTKILVRFNKELPLNKDILYLLFKIGGDVEKIIEEENDLSKKMIEDIERFSIQLKNEANSLIARCHKPKFDALKDLLKQCADGYVFFSDIDNVNNYLKYLQECYNKIEKDKFFHFDEIENFIKQILSLVSTLTANNTRYNNKLFEFYKIATEINLIEQYYNQNISDYAYKKLKRELSVDRSYLLILYNGNENDKTIIPTLFTQRRQLENEKNKRWYKFWN